MTAIAKRLSKKMFQNIFEKDLEEFIKNRNSLSTCFENFAKALRKNGDLGANLMTFIRKIAII